MRYVAVLTCLLVGCATSLTKTNQLEQGMTKKEVIALLGNPSSVAANGPTQLMRYKLDPGFDMSEGMGLKEYWVFIENNIVTQFGKPGDFGNSRDPTMKLIIEKQ
jgi:hypothetical protein